MQVVLRRRGEAIDSLELPDAKEWVIERVPWGRVDELFTPAYWAAQSWLSKPEVSTDSLRIGDSLCEEISACLLGGYGMPAEIGLAAFRRLKARGLLNPPSSIVDIQDALRKPLNTWCGAKIYRFATQKACYLYEFLSDCPITEPKHLSDRAFRDWLLRYRGIGPKTASWITRNWRNSDEVAIIDVHIHRAGVLAGFFPHGSTPQADYRELESTFLAFCKGLGVRASLLDGLIWEQMRSLGGRQAAKMGQMKLPEATHGFG